MTTARKPTLHLQGSQVKNLPTWEGWMNYSQLTMDSTRCASKCTQNNRRGSPPHQGDYIKEFWSAYVHCSAFTENWHCQVKMQHRQRRLHSPGSPGMCWKGKGVWRHQQRRTEEGKTFPKMWGKDMTWHNNHTLNTYKNTVQSES